MNDIYYLKKPLDCIGSMLSSSTHNYISRHYWLVLLEMFSQELSKRNEVELYIFKRIHMDYFFDILQTSSRAGKPDIYSV